VTLRDERDGAAGGEGYRRQRWRGAGGGRGGPGGVDSVQFEEHYSYTRHTNRRTSIVFRVKLFRTTVHNAYCKTKIYLGTHDYIFFFNRNLIYLHIVPITRILRQHNIYTNKPTR